MYKTGNQILTVQGTPMIFGGEWMEAVFPQTSWGALTVADLLEF